MKRIIAALLAGLCLFALVGCSAGSKADSAAPKDYSQIIHDARTDEDNEYDMIFTKTSCSPCWALRTAATRALPPRFPP